MRPQHTFAFAASAELRGISRDKFTQDADR